MGEMIFMKTNFNYGYSHVTHPRIAAEKFGFKVEVSRTHKHGKYGVYSGPYIRSPIPTSLRPTPFHFWPDYSTCLFEFENENPRTVPGLGPFEFQNSTQTVTDF